jgi:hypothetical protein
MIINSLLSTFDEEEDEKSLRSQFDVSGDFNVASVGSDQKKDVASDVISKNNKKRIIDVPELNTEEQTETTSTETTQEPTKNETTSGDGLNIDLKLPDVSLPDVDIPKVDIGVPQLDLNIELPDLDLGLDLSKLPPVDIQVPTLDLGVDLSLDGINLPELKVPDIPIPNTNLEPVEEAMSAVEQATKPVVDNAIDAVKDVASTTEQVIAPVVQETAQVAETTYNTVRDELSKVVADIPLPLASLPDIPNLDLEMPDLSVTFPEIDTKYITDNSFVKKGTGEEYGEVAIGNTGFVVDSSKIVDDVYNNVTKDTILEGTAGKDVFDLVSDPQKFAENKLNQGIEDTLVNNIGIDSGIAGGIVDVLKDGNVDQAVKKVAAEVVESAVVSTVCRGIDAVIPGAGVVVEVVYNIVKKCFSEDTLISTPTGLVKAKDLKVGDTIHTWHKGNISNTKLLKIFVSMPDHVYEIKTKTRTIRLTQHPIHGRFFFRDFWFMGNILETVLPAFKTRFFALDITTRLLPMCKGVKLYKTDNTLEKVISYKKINKPTRCLDFVADCHSSKIIGDGFILWAIPTKYVDKILNIPRYSDMGVIE